MSEEVVKAGSRRPWVGLAAAVWVLFAAGNNYNFALFSPALKSILGYDQRQMAILGVANDIGTNFGLLAGIAVNHFSPFHVILVGSLLCLFGYGVIWRVLTQPAWNSRFSLLFVALLIGSNSVSWFQTAVIVTNMRNFPQSRGTVSGILKAFVGLSAAIYAVMYSSVFDKSDSSFLLFHALGLPIICLCVMYFIRRCTPDRGEYSSEGINFQFIQVVSLVLAIYLLAVNILSDKFSVGKSVSYMFSGLMLLFMLVPVAIPIKMTLFPANNTKSVNSSEEANSSEGSSDVMKPSVDGSPPTPPFLDGSPSSFSHGDILESKDDSKVGFPALNEGISDLTKPFLEASQDEGAETLFKGNPSGYSHVSLLASGYAIAASNVDILLAIGMGGKPRRGENFKFQVAIIKADFWLLWLLYFLGVGSGVTVLNNLSQIGYAQGERDTTILLSLFAFFNFVGRLGGGDLSERMVRSKSIPRTMLLTIIQALMVLSFVLYTFSLRATLYSATTLLGICYGVHSAVMTPTASELFGLKHVGLIYNFIQLGNPIGASLFSVLLAGNLYDVEAKKQGVSTCLGPTCFRLTFVILAGVSALGIVLGLILTWRIKSVYERLYPRDRLQ